MRSAGARSAGSSRRYSMKPVGLPMLIASGSQLQEKVGSTRRRSRFSLRKRLSWRTQASSTTPDARHVARVFFKGGGDRVVATQPGFVGLFQSREDAFVILRHHLDELRHHVLPELDDVAAPITAGVAHVAFDPGAHLGGLPRA